LQEDASSSKSEVAAASANAEETSAPLVATEPTEDDYASTSDRQPKEQEDLDDEEDDCNELRRRTSNAQSSTSMDDLVVKRGDIFSPDVKVSPLGAAASPSEVTQEDVARSVTSAEPEVTDEDWVTVNKRVENLDGKLHQIRMRVLTKDKERYDKLIIRLDPDNAWTKDAIHFRDTESRVGGKVYRHWPIDSADLSSGEYGVDLDVSCDKNRRRSKVKAKRVLQFRARAHRHLSRSRC